jgi:hypothetical protein
MLNSDDGSESIYSDSASEWQADEKDEEDNSASEVEDSEEEVEDGEAEIGSREE